MNCNNLKTKEKSIFWKIIGKGKQNLVMVHGWGLNSNIWSFIIDKLKPYFCIHLVDIPGYGRSKRYKILTLEEITKEIIKNAPSKAIWLGWSFGGLIAIEAAYIRPDIISKLIIVTSSPRFCLTKNWPGILPKVLENFAENLIRNFKKSINTFINLQIINSSISIKKIEILKEMIINKPIPTMETLYNDLMILKSCDLRFNLSKLVDIPKLYIYGNLDKIIPKSIIPMIENLSPKSFSICIHGSAHAPFISHSKIFCNEVINFTKK